MPFRSSPSYMYGERGRERSHLSSGTHGCRSAARDYDGIMSRTMIASGVSDWAFLRILTSAAAENSMKYCLKA